MLKALCRGARILILDEPTTVLTPQEADQLFSSVRDMAAAGRTVIFISHKLPEVLAVADRVTILRQGRSVTTVPTAGTDADDLAGLMVGREVSLGGDGQGPSQAPGAAVLELAGVCARGDLGAEALKDIDARGAARRDPRHRRCLGQRPTRAGRGHNRAPADHRAVRSGSGGHRCPTGDPRAAIDLGVAYVPEDRMGTGIAPNLSIAENLILKSYRGKAMRSGPVISSRKAIANAKDTDASVSTCAPRARARWSGSSRVATSKRSSWPASCRPSHGCSWPPRPRVAWTWAPPSTCGVSWPRRRRSGVGVVMVSEDLDEIFELSDRIAVFYNGRVVGIVEAAEADRQQVGLMMAGARVSGPLRVERRLDAPRWLKVVVPLASLVLAGDHRRHLAAGHRSQPAVDLPPDVLRRHHRRRRPVLDFCLCHPAPFHRAVRRRSPSG